MQKFIARILTFFITSTLVFSLTAGVSHAFSEKALDQYKDRLTESKVIPENPDMSKTVKEVEFLQYILLNSPDFDSTSKLRLPNPSYTNVPKINPQAKYIYTALGAGLITISDDGKYNFNKELTRISALNMAFELYGIDMPKLRKPTITFSDIPQESKYARIVARAIELNLIDPLKPQTFGLNEKMKMSDVIRLIGGINKSIQDEGKVLIITPKGIEKQEIMIDVYKKIKELYVYDNEITENQLSYGAISGMVNSLNDRYSVFNSPAGTKQFLDTTSGEFEGIGVWLEKEGEYISIGGVVPKSPAEEAKLKVGDRIIKINGKDARNWTPEQVAGEVKGPAGTEVTFYLEKHASGSREQVKVKRAKIVMTFVTGEILDKKYAYIDISQFPQDINKDFNKVLKQVVNSDTKGIIMDLRNNPGGYVTAAEDLLSHFLKKDDVMYYLDYRSGDKVIKSKSTGELRNIPLIVLVDQSSASASEIVSAALKDHKIATIIGKKTFGKGVAQQVFFYDDGSSLKLTIAEWLSPAKELINKNGVNPDIEIEDDPKTTRDEAIDRCIRYFKNGN